jgi:flagellar biosynthesis protein FlhF
MSQALDALRRELGQDALILATSRVRNGVEITAAQPDAAEGALPPAKNGAAAPAGTELEEALLWHGVPAALISALTRQNQPLPRALAGNIAFGIKSLAEIGRPWLIAGPGGSGKTLMAARLAAQLSKSGRRPYLVSTDHSRAGAAEHLLGLSAALKLDIVAAPDARLLARALRHSPAGAQAIIDTGACDPFAAGQLAHIAAMVAATGAIMLCLLPAWLNPEEAADIATGFARHGAAGLLISRLDTTRRLGAILSAAHGAALPLGFASASADPAHPPVKLSAAFLARRLSTRSGDSLAGSPL